MKRNEHRANLAAAIVALVGIVLAWMGSTLSEGQFVCISKTTLLWLAAVMGGVSRVVNYWVRGRRLEGGSGD